MAAAVKHTSRLVRVVFATAAKREQKQGKNDVDMHYHC
jgi:hypothetical protein